jgi:hypothetical protein
MRIKPTERQQVASIIQEEMGEAGRRITDRLTQFERRSSAETDEDGSGIRRFYEDLVDKPWTKADEEALKGLGKAGESEIRQVIRDSYRRSRVHPIPSLAYLINLAKKEDVVPADEGGDMQLKNPDAVSAAERERLANLLFRELSEAAHEIASRLQLNDAKAELVRERLQIAEGNIIAGFTPLV